MESILKKELFDNGFISFHLNDLDADLYRELERLFPIESLVPNRFNHLRNSVIELKRKSPYEHCIMGKSFDELEIIKNDILENYRDGINNTVDQIWYYGYPSNPTDSIELVGKIFKKFYEIDTAKPSSQLTMYNDGCYLLNHQDASDGENKPNCVILIYLSTDYSDGNGGELIVGNKLKVEPIYGNVAIMDFTKHNPHHAVTEVKNYNRFCYINFC
jgi:Rps23 Pro-64 3,4-dihydroxylase Tpa1-like proline 4-hydroxylase